MSVAPPSAASSRVRRAVRLAWLRDPILVPCAIIVALFAIGASISSSFASIANIWGLLAVASVLAVASAAQGIVIISGNQGIDLSLGSTITLAALLTSHLANSVDAELPVTLLIVIAMSVAVGTLNFVGVWLVGIYPLIMTLGMSFVLAGGAFVYAQDHGPALPSPLLLAIGVEKVGPVPWLVIIAAVIGLALVALLRWSRFGQQLYLVGANPRAARFSGIPVGRIFWLSYVLASGLAGLTGVLLFAFSGSANLSIGSPYTLMSIAAAVIGGTALTGGRGSITGAYLGAIVFTVLSNLLIVMGLGPAAREVLSGVVLLAILIVTAREKAASF